jgi:hypothetical protein
MTAYASARTAMEKLGGKNRIIVVAEIQQQGAFGDEDDITFILKRCYSELARSQGCSSLVYLAGSFFAGYGDKNVLVEDFIDIFMDKLIRKGPQKYRLPAAKAEQLIKAEIMRLLAHQLSHSTETTKQYELKKLSIPDLTVLSVNEAEAQYLKLRGELTRTYKYGVYATDDNTKTTLRTEEVVGFSGANKIVCIVEHVAHRFEDRDFDYSILHYGTIPDSYREQYRKMIGAWRPVHDREGNVIEKGDRSLTEGLIQVPKSMLDYASEYVEFMVMWWAQTEIQGKKKQFPEHAAAFKKLRDRLPYRFPKPTDPFPVDGVKIETMNLDLSDMPSNYAGLVPNRKKIHIAVDFRFKSWGGSIGGWIDAKNAIVVCPMNLDYLRNWLHGDADNVGHALDELKETLAHEFRHMVQSVLLADVDPSQIERLGDYAATNSMGNRGSDYFTSPVEFDPTIGSAAHSFLVHYNILKQHGNKMSLSVAIKKFVGAARPDMFSGMWVDDFFKYWKKKDRKQWAIAVKKFIQEVDRLLKLQN